MRREFYVSVAHLFYAVATIDKLFAMEEKRKIVNLVKRYFSTEIGEEQSSEIIYETLRSLIKQEVSSEEGYQKFLGYFKLNQEQFDEITKKNIIIFCHEIADVFSGKNKSELILLARIQTQLK